MERQGLGAESCGAAVFILDAWSLQSCPRGLEPPPHTTLAWAQPRPPPPLSPELGAPVHLHLLVEWRPRVCCSVPAAPPPLPWLFLGLKRPHQSCSSLPRRKHCRKQQLGGCGWGGLSIRTGLPRPGHRAWPLSLAGKGLGPRTLFSSKLLGGKNSRSWWAERAGDGREGPPAGWKGAQLKDLEAPGLTALSARLSRGYLVSPGLWEPLVTSSQHDLRPRACCGQSGVSRDGNWGACLGEPPEQGPGDTWEDSEGWPTRRKGPVAPVLNQ